MGTPPNSSSQALQNALAAIEQQYDAAMNFIAAMKNDSAQIAKDQQSAAGWLTREYYTTVSAAGHGELNYHHHTDWKAIAYYNADEADIAAKQADITKQGNALKALDPTFANLCNSLESLLASVQQIAFSGGASDLVSTDLGAINTALNSIFTAMQQKLTGDMYDAEMHSNVSDQLTNAQLQQLALQALGSQNDELNTLNDLMTSLTTLVNDYHTDYDNAKTDKARYDFFEIAFSKDGEKTVRDDQVMDNAKLMMDCLTNVMHSLTPEIASIMPAFTQVLDVIQQVIKEVKEILANAKMTPKEKQGAVLALVMFLLTFFGVVKQDVESQKAKNNQDMTNGSINASKTNIEDSVMNQTIKEESERNAKIMKIAMIVMQVVVGALMMIAAPGAGTALMVGMMTAFETLQTAGVFNATQALGTLIGGKNGQIFADVIVGVTEAALTMGGGALLDKVAAKVIINLVEKVAVEALEVGEEAIEKAAQAAATAAGKAGEQTAVDAAESTLTKVGFNSAKKGAEGAAQQFMKQPFGTLVELFIKGDLTSSLKTVMEKAAQEALQTGIDDAGTIAKLAARGISTSEEIVDGMSTKAANQAVAKVSGKEIATVAKEAESTQKPWSTAASRGATALVFGLDSNNLWVDIAKRTGADKDDGLMIFLQVLQQLLQMIAMMGGSGMMSGSTMEGVASKLPRIAGYLSMIPQTGDSAAALSNYETYSVEGKAVTGLALNGSVSDLLHSFLEQLQKDGNLDRDIMIKEQQQSAQSTQALAGHLHDGDQAAIQALISAV